MGEIEESRVSPGATDGNTAHSGRNIHEILPSTY